MTVKELIEKLQAFPQEAEIVLEDEIGDRASIRFVAFTGRFVIINTEGAELK